MPELDADAVYSWLYQNEPHYRNGPTGLLWEFLDRRMPKRAKRLRVLDAGCGLGAMVHRFRAQGCRVAGLDAASYAVDAFAGPEVVRGSLTDLPYGRAAFDLIWCCDVLEHLAEENLPAVLGEFARCGSRLIASVCLRPAGFRGPNGEQLHLTVQPAAWWTGYVMAHFPNVHTEHPKLHHLLLDAQP